MSPQPQPGSKKDATSAAKPAQRPPKPFEPTSRSAPAAKGAAKVSKPASAKAKAGHPRKTDSGIPEVVSRRMVRRIALFCGIPTALGMSTFLVSYWVVSHDWLQLPTYAVLLVSLGWFGLGVLGVSYGVLSSSWDEAAGSWLGISEFATNWGRMTEAWRSQKDKS